VYKRKAMFGVLAATITICIVGTVSYSEINAALLGTGSKENPYKIISCGDLQSINEDLSAHYVIEEDIDCIASTEWRNNECGGLNNKSMCLEGNQDCEWIDESVCKDEIFDGCAFGPRDCMRWCRGTWEDSGSCTDENGFKPIGNRFEPFTGSLDGKGKEIKNLSLNWPTRDGVGIFGWVQDASIQNLKVVNARVEGNHSVGVIAGVMQGGSIERVHIDKSNVLGKWGVGGLIGSTGLGNQKVSMAMLSSYNNNISGEESVGGLVGYLEEGRLEKSASVNNQTTGEYNIGGIGGQSSKTLMRTLFTESTISGKSKVGGMWGLIDNKSELSQSVSYSRIDCDKEVECDDNFGGGLVAYKDGSSVLETSYYDKDISNQTDKGKGVGLSSEDLIKKETFKNWNWNEIWEQREDKKPFISGLPKPPYELKPTEEDKREEVLDGGVISGRVLSRGKKPLEGSVEVALSINGDAVVASSNTGKDGKFRMEGIKASAGDVLALIINGSESYHGITITSYKNDMGDVEVHQDQLRIQSSSKLDSNKLSEYLSNGGYYLPGISDLVDIQKKEIRLKGKRLMFVGAGASLGLSHDLTVYRLINEGEIAQNKNKITVEEDYVQNGGTFVAGKGDAIFERNIVINGGEFRGGEGDVKFVNDLVGLFELKKGTFSAPKELIINTDWNIQGGEFIHNKGLVVFEGTSHKVNPGKSLSLYDVDVSKEDETMLMVDESGIINIENSFTLTDGELRGGSIICTGDIVHSANFDGGDTLLKITGSDKKDIEFKVGGKLPEIELDAKNAKVSIKKGNIFNRIKHEDNAFVVDSPILMKNGTFVIEDGNVWIHADLNMEGGK